MAPRRSLKLPITLGVVMMSMLVVLTVGWILMSAVGGLSDRGQDDLRVVLLVVGTSFSGLLLVGVAMYLGLSVKAINLARRQSNFIDSVTPELKSPIASMKLYLQTLLRHPVDEESRNGFYDRMLADLERLDQLIDHMLDAGRLESPGADEDAEDLLLTDAVRECAEITWLRHGVPPETFRFEFEPVVVHAPRLQLLVLLRNLLDNAVKYAGRPPRVEVRVRLVEGNRAVVRISDNGAGIAPGMRRKIFGRFVRLGSELERRRPGTGLGLFVVRKLADRMQARVRVRDRAEGSGTVFEFELPGERAPAPVAEGADG